jgi:quercetin 2,3-dioxygenase
MINTASFLKAVASVSFFAKVTGISSSSSSEPMCASKASSHRIIKVPSSKLFISEPNPSWFGNEGNPGYNPHWTESNWLKSRFHFSFAEYNNRQNSNFGCIRVVNDDLVQPSRGFGTHPHANQEIVTYIVEGKLTHQDSMGTKESLGRGSVQFMTAGTGVRHSEHNLSDDKPLRFIQTWIIPSRNNLPPNYGSSVGDETMRWNKWQHLVTSVDNKEAKATVQINQDCNAYSSELDELGKTITIPLSDGRMAYIIALEGSVRVGDVVLERHDAAEITPLYSGGNGEIDMTAVSVEMAEHGKEVAHVLLFEMQHVPGAAGREDL